MNNLIGVNATPENCRSSCPVANVLDIVGDKWTLLVIRDLFMGKHRYGEFLSSPEAIPTNILAERLKRLEAAEMIKKTFYQHNPPRAEYYLTRKGADLEPILMTMADWASRYVSGVMMPQPFGTPQIRE